MASWSTRRQALYFTLVTLVFLAIAGTFVWIHRPIPSCHDGRQNNGEEGIDCGSPCSLACPNRIVPLKILWSREFEISNGVYDVAALVENSNPFFGLPQMSYKAKLFDQDNVLIAQRSGVTPVNPGERFVIYESGLSSGERIGSRAFVELNTQGLDWVRVTTPKAEVSIDQLPFTNTPTPRLEAVIKNNSLRTLRDMKFVAVLSDESGNAFAVSGSYIDELAAGGNKSIIFTWRQPFTEMPKKIEIYPVVNIFDTR